MAANTKFEDLHYLFRLAARSDHDESFWIAIDQLMLSYQENVLANGEHYGSDDNRLTNCRQTEGPGDLLSCMRTTQFLLKCKQSEFPEHRRLFRAIDQLIDVYTQLSIELNLSVRAVS